MTRAVLKACSSLAIGLALTNAPVHAQSGDSTASAPPPSYTAEQAGRGEQVYQRVCIECHTLEELSGSEFKQKWNGRNAFELFFEITTKMPDGDPGSLPQEDYIDVLSYVFKLNGIPAGTAPLSADSAVLARSRLNILPAGGGAGAAGQTLPSQLAWLRPSLGTHARPLTRR